MRASRFPEQFAHWPRELLDRLDAAYLAVTPFTIAEEKVGHLKAKWSPARVVAYEQRLKRLLLIPLDHDIIDVYAHLRVECEQRGATFGYHDLWIGATAAARSIPLVSCDRRQCEIPGIETLYLPLFP